MPMFTQTKEKSTHATRGVYLIVSLGSVERVINSNQFRLLEPFEVFSFHGNTNFQVETHSVKAGK